MKYLFIILFVPFIFLYGQVTYQEDFTGNAYDHDVFTMIDSGSKWTITNGHLEGTFGAGGDGRQVDYYYYKFKTKIASSASSDFDVRGRIWKNSTSGNRSIFLGIWASEQYYAGIVVDNDAEKVSAIINNGGGEGIYVYLQDTGLSVSDSTNYFRVTYDRSTDSLKYYNWSGSSWTQLLTTQVVDFDTLHFSPSMSGGIFNAVAGDTIHGDDFYASYTPYGYVPPPAITLTNPPSNEINLGNLTRDLMITWEKTGIDTAYLYLNDSLFTSTTKLFHILSADELFLLRRQSDTLKIKIEGAHRILTGGTPVVPPTPPTGVNNPTITGTGTVADPYVIYSAQQYLDFIDTVSVVYKHIALGNDWDFANIELTQYHIINIHERAWFGRVEGNGFTIKNFNITREPTDTAFTEIAYAIFREAFSIKNLIVDSCNIRLDRPIRAVVGEKDTPSPVIHKGESVFMNDAWIDGRQINIVVNSIYGTSDDEYSPDSSLFNISNIKIRNCSIYVDYSNLPAKDWNWTNIAMFSSATSGKGNHDDINIDGLFIDSANIYYKGNLVEKELRIGGAVIEAGEVKNSYFNGNIIFDALTDSISYEASGSLGISIFGFGDVQHLKNCYTKGNIQCIKPSNYTFINALANSHGVTPNFENSYYDESRNRFFSAFDNYSVQNMGDTALFNSIFTHLSGAYYWFSYGTIHYSYSNMLINGNSPYTIYQETYLYRGVNSFDTMIARYSRDIYENQLVSHLDYFMRKVYEGITYGGSYASFYNTDKITNEKLDPRPEVRGKFGRTANQMRDKSMYEGEGWDFYSNEGWRISSSINDGFPNLTIDTIYTYSYEILASDSTTLIFPPMGRTTNLTTLYIEPGNIAFDTFSVSVGDTVVFDVTVESSGIDSIYFYYSFQDIPDSSDEWIYSTKLDTVPSSALLLDTVTVSVPVIFPPDWERGELKIKAKEQRGIEVIPVADYTRIGSGYIPDKRICYGGYSTRTVIESNWTRDLSCGWSSSWGRDYGLTTLSDSGLVYNVTYTHYEPGFKPAYPPASDSFYVDNFRRLKGNNYIYNNLLYRGYKYVYLNNYDYDTLPSGYTTNPLHSIGIVDWEQIGDTSLYCDLSPLYTQTQWTPPVFVGTNLLAAYTIPYSVLEGGSFTSSEIEAFLLQDSFPEQGFLTWQPLLLVQSTGSSPRGQTVAIPMMKKHTERNDSPIAYDVYEIPFLGKYKRNYFRGIHPKIWKYGNPQGIKP